MEPRLHVAETRLLKAISLFTGAGGLDFGLEAAGFQTLLAVERDSDCCLTIRANRDWPLIERDINKIPSKELLDTAGLRQGEPHLLHGGPACQPFSKSAYWASGDTRRLDDPRGDTLHAFMRCVRDLLPEVFLLENVHGIKYSGKEEGFRLLENLSSDINLKYGTRYKLSWAVLNAAEYGVPQLRRRFFLIGHREGRTFRFPDPSHVRVDSPCSGSPLYPYVTSWDAIGDLDQNHEEDTQLRGRWAELLPSIPEGQNYLWHTDRKGGQPLFGWRTRYWSFLLKLAKALPSWTIQAHPGPATGPFHWDNRRLGRAELMRLQTFPHDITIPGSLAKVQRQVGNAVPSLLAEVIGRAIGEQFFDQAYPELLKNRVILQRPIPPPNKPTSVTGKYMHLAGDHRPHPGPRRRTMA